MCWDLIVLSIKELFVKRKRTILLIAMMAISVVFITTLTTVSSGLREFVFERVNTDARSKQLQLQQDEGENLTLLGIPNLIAETGATGARVILAVSYQVVGMNLIEELPYLSVAFFDSAYDLLTECEREKFDNDPLFGPDTIMLVAREVPGDKALPQELSLSVYNPLDKSMRALALRVTDTLPKDLMAQINGDLIANCYISSNYLPAGEYGVHSLTLEYETQAAALAAYDYFYQEGYTLTMAREEAARVRAEDLVYRSIFTFFGAVVLIVTGSIISSSMNISFKERIAYYGLLKALGMTKFRIWFICFFQSVLIAFTGWLVGSLFAQVTLLSIKNSVVETLISPLFYNLSTISFGDILAGSKQTLFMITMAGALSGLGPALKAVRGSSISALTLQ